MTWFYGTIYGCDDIDDGLINEVVIHFQICQTVYEYHYAHVYIMSFVHTVILSVGVWLEDEVGGQIQLTSPVGRSWIP